MKDNPIKRITSVIILLILLLCFTACGEQTAENHTSSPASSAEDMTTERDMPMNADSTAQGNGKTLVAYFSCTNTTEGMLFLVY